MHVTVQRMLQLGKINLANQHEFIELLNELPEALTLEEAENLFGIFSEEDYNDYCAFAWDLLFRLEKVRGIRKSMKLKKSKTYWISILRNSVYSNCSL